ncbi:retron St85 family RNA-directed DNA polymerase [Aureimonas sp. SK2]|uniref:retron St85 family RNA-directed DNA polymerase n=1 Tax=Aureimonas sp. SK2 TaxID=3015992 RepID=UPI002444706B|nr:retron St85 family RNA-directed DNA polymerase [Aureimonas sp. SK2]
MSKILGLLSQSTGIGPLNLLRIIRDAPKSYKIFYIPKKNGDSREIAQPSAELKIVQRALVSEYLVFLPCHPAATAYRSGLSLKDNATPHAGHTPIAKFDFKDFFPSITENDWITYCRKFTDLDKLDIDLTRRLLFMRQPGGRILRLSIGAPSSPILSNVIMYNFDSILAEHASRDEVTYTRYADDMTFSAPRAGHLRNIEKYIRQAVKEAGFPKLQLNKEKTTLVTTRFSRRVTGLTLANDGRVTIGSERKRWIRSALHHLSIGTISLSDRERLSGLLAFANGVEPAYLDKLKKDYGEEFIDDTLRIKPRQKWKGPSSRLLPAALRAQKSD